MTTRAIRRVSCASFIAIVGALVFGCGSEADDGGGKGNGGNSFGSTDLDGSASGQGCVTSSKRADRCCQSLSGSMSAG